MFWLDAALSDVRYGARTLARRPIFAIVAIMTLGAGIASTTAMFSLVDGIVLRPLPFPRADQLVEVIQSYPEKTLDRWTLSQENAAMYRGLKSFTLFAAHSRTGLTLEASGQADRVVAEVVTGDFFPLLGVKPLVGRIIGRDDDRPGNANVAVLSFGFWQSQFGGSRDITARTIQLNGQPTRIVGVMPEGFAFPKGDVQLYVPLGLDPTRAHPNFLTGVARLRDGVSSGRAAQEATATMWEWARRSPTVVAGLPPERTKMHVVITPLRTAIAGSVTRPLVALQVAVALILLIATANVATLIGTRAIGRSRETAVRAALGATRRRLVAQMIMEGLIVSMTGGVLGVFGATALVRAFVHSSFATLPRIGEVGTDWRVLFVASIASIFAGFVVALASPSAVRGDAVSAALAGQRASSGRRARTTNNVLIAIQVALSFVLLVGAGLMLKSFRRLVTTELGFEPAGVVSVTMPLPAQRYGMNNRPRSFTFVEQLVANASRLTGVRNAAVMFPAMYVNDVNSDGFIIEGHEPAPGAVVPQTVQYSVSPGLFRTLRVPLIAGRDFTGADRANALPVVIVDQTLISRLWSPSEAIGRRIKMTGDTAWSTIIGVVGDIRDEGVAELPRPHTYSPYAQSGGSRPTLVVRSDTDQSTVVAEVRGAVAAIDPGVPTDNPHPVAAAIASSLATRRITEVLLTGFAGLAVLLAACGLYGVMSMYVANRRREFGIRAAIGARPGELVRVVAGEGAALVGGGVVIGLLVSLVAGRVIRSLLYEVSPNDAAVYVGVAGVLAVVGALACYLPARRAANSDPLLVLRQE